MNTTTYPYNQDVDYDAYRFTVVPEADNVERHTTLLNAVEPITTGEQEDNEWMEAARQLHHHTGHKPVMVHDGGHYIGLHVPGRSRYSLLADSMGGTPTLLVLQHGHYDQQLVLMRQSFADWTLLARAAAAVKLDR